MANATPANTATKRKPVAKADPVEAPVEELANPSDVMADLEALAQNPKPQTVILEDVTMSLKPAEVDRVLVEDEELAKAGVKYLGEDKEFISIGGNIFFASAEKRMEQAQVMQARRGNNVFADMKAAQGKTVDSQGNKLAVLGAYLPRSKSFRGVPYRKASGSICVNW